MVGKPTDASTSAFKLGSERTEAIASMQKELLHAYEQANRTWLARVKSEADRGRSWPRSWQRPDPFRKP